MREYYHVQKQILMSILSYHDTGNCERFTDPWCPILNLLLHHSQSHRNCQVNCICLRGEDRGEGS